MVTYKVVEASLEDVFSFLVDSGKERYIRKIDIRND